MWPRRGERREPDRGAMAALSVLFIIILILVLGLIINVGRLMRTRGDLQHAADSAALAAMEILDNKSTGITGGRTPGDYDGGARSIQGQAVRFGRKYLLGGVAGQLATVNTSYGGDYDSTAVGHDFVVGFWHDKSGAFERRMFEALAPWNVAGTTPFEPKPGPDNNYDRLAINAVKVTTRYTLPPFLGAFMGLGNTTMMARATAVSRRQRVRCALPFAVSSCQLDDTGNTLVTNGPTIGFTCPSGPRSFTFASGVERDVAVVPGLPGGDYTATGLARVDTIGDGVSGPLNDYRDWVRTATEDWDCSARAGWQVTGVAETPPHYRNDLGPIIDGLLGITTWNTEPAVGSTCALGRTLVMPMIAVDHGSCPDALMNWPHRSGTAYGKARVFTYLNVRFTQIRCADGTFLREPGSGADACDSNPARARTCSGHPLSAANLRLSGQIDCNAPVATGPGPTAAPARLIR